MGLKLENLSANYVLCFTFLPKKITFNKQLKVSMVCGTGSTFENLSEAPFRQLTIYHDRLTRGNERTTSRKNSTIIIWFWLVSLTLDSSKSFLLLHKIDKLKEKEAQVKNFHQY